MLKKLLICAQVMVFTTLFTTVIAQNILIDSLYKELKSAKHDTSYYNVYHFLGDSYQGVNADSSFYYLDKAIVISKKLKDDLKLAESYKVKGWTYYTLSDYDSAQICYEEALILCDNLLKKNTLNKEYTTKIKKTKAASIRNIGVLYDAKSLYPEAIKRNFEALKIYQEIGDEVGQASVYLSLGVSYKDLEDYERALDYYLKSINLYQKHNYVKGLTANYINVGNLYYDLNEYDTTIHYYNKALEIYIKTDNQRGLGIVLGNIGGVFEKKGDEKSALDYYTKALKINQELGNKRIQIINMIDVGNVNLQLKNYKLAEEYYVNAFLISKEIEANDLIIDTYLNLSIFYETTEKYKNSLDFYKKHINYRDSIFSVESKNQSIELEYQFEYEIKKAKDSIENVKQIEIVSLDNLKQKAEIKANTIQKYALFGGLFILLVFIGFIYNRFKITQRQKNIIEQQKAEVETQREFAEQQRQIAEEKRVEADEQKHLVEEKNKEITDSINYAKRIQEAILPSRYSLVENLKNGFVFFKPKDIVSGDFYWLETTTPNPPPSEGAKGVVSNGGGTGVVYFAAADCTGHGVPGAMVSVICSNALSKALLEEGITQTGKLLDRTRELVIERFAKSGEQVKDGMDISLCKLQDNILEWSGANNPLWIVSKNSEGENELTEVKADKQPIGNYAEPKPFTTHTIQLSEGNSIYIFTDGFADQFGGPKGKKFMYKPFKELLLSIQDKTMDEQKVILENQFNDWKGGNEQIDDICIIGVRI